MSETIDQVETDETPVLDEKAILLQRAKMMGIKVSNNASIETLKAKIDAKQAEPTEETAAAPALVAPGEVAPGRTLSLREQIRQDSLKLIRLRITNLDPKKKDLPGEIYTVANRYLGTVRKFVPFGEVTENGYHVPYVIYEMMKEKRFQNIRTVRRNGKEVIESNFVPEFALEVLPMLTQKEIDELKAAQAAAGGTD